MQTAIKDYGGSSTSTHLPSCGSSTVETYVRQLEISCTNGYSDKVLQISVSDSKADLTCL